MKRGTRIKLIHMPDDPDPIPEGTEGTVEAVYEMSFDRTKQISVKWDNGRSLMLITPPDVFEVVG